MRKIGIALMLLSLIVLMLMIALLGYLSRFDDALNATMTAVYRK